MANHEQLEILKQGVDVWNKWREENPEVDIRLAKARLETVNLNHLNLIGASLRHANLSDASLRWANLRESVLKSANLSRADFSHAMLIEAKLHNVHLQRAILRQANLYRANLSRANLIGANLNGAKMIGTNLIGANLKEANLSKVSLRKAKLRRAKLWHANLKGAELQNADLRGSLLGKAILKNAKLSGANLRKASLREADLKDAELTKANLFGVDLRGANLSRANLSGADLSKTNLSGADIREANLSGADLFGADLRDADLAGVILFGARLVQTNLVGARLTGCYIYGISAWNLELADAEQSDLIITRYDEPVVTVDNLEVAQFIYLMLNNENIRGVLDTIGKKGVLILGRFTPERKQVLDALREKLRALDYVPIMFDFEGAASKDFTETVKILAGMSRFIIADITNPKSSPLELQATVPDYMVPFVPIIQDGEEPFAMFADLQNKYDWVLDVLEFENHQQLTAVAEKAIIQPALEKELELIPRKAEETRKRHAKDFLSTNEKRGW